jgi:hemolysin activation/secretion protein
MKPTLQAAPRTLTALAAITLTSLGLILPSQAQAQALPAAGQPSAGGGLPIGSVPISGTGAAPTGQASGNAVTRLPIKSFRFTGNSAFTSDALTQQLQLILTPEGVRFDDLNAAVDRITRSYRAAGYIVAKAYLPPQTSADGIIHIHVLEGQHSAPSLKNTSAASAETLNAVVQTALCNAQTPNCTGAFVHDDSNERALRLLNDIPGVTATATLSPGKEIGSSTLNLIAKPSTLPTSTVGVDNYGSKATGVYRLNLSSDFNNLRGVGDQLTLSGNGSGRRLWSGALGYSVMAGSAGTRIGATLGHGQYLLGDAFTALNAHGSANTLGAYISHPFLRHRERNLSVRATLESKSLTDHILNIVPLSKNATALGVSTIGDWVDTLGGGGYNSYSAVLTSGTIRLNDTASQASDANGAKTAGGFSKTGFFFSRQQAVTGPWTLYGAVSGQWTSQNLDASERIGLGGSGGVRGYAAGEGAGDRGGVGSLELRRTQVVEGNTTLTYTAFLDRGWSENNVKPWAGGVTTTRALTGYGVSVLLIKPYDYSVRAVYASHKASQLSTIDPANKHQVWLQASKSF